MSQSFGLVIDSAELHDQHPEFSKHKPKSYSLTVDEGLNELFKELDEVVNLFSQTTINLDRARFIALVNRNISPIVKQIENTALSVGIPSERIKKTLINSLESFRAALVQYVDLKCYERYSNLNASISPLTRQIADDLHVNGISLTNLPAELIAQLEQVVRPHVNDELSTNHLDNRKLKTAPLPNDSEYVKCLFQIASEVGLTDGAKLFFNDDVEPYYACWHYATNEEDWYNSPFPNVETSGTAYGHFDHDYQLVKIIFYLTEVTESGGPFTVIPRSSDISFGSFSKNFFYKYLDQALSKLNFEDAEPNSRFYKPRYTSRQFLEEFMLLPAALRGSSHLGDEVLKGSLAEQIILSREMQITSNISNAFIFYGGQTYHRGGMVRKGNRLVVQLGLIAKNFK